jgi:hypothetical protein
MDERTTAWVYTCECAAGHETRDLDEPISSCSQIDQYTQTTCGRVVHCTKTEVPACDLCGRASKSLTKCADRGEMYGSECASSTLSGYCYKCRT